MTSASEVRICDWYENRSLRGRIDKPTHTAEGCLALSGSIIRIDLEVNANHQVTRAMFDGDGTVLSIASAAMIVEWVHGKFFHEIEALSEDDSFRMFGLDMRDIRKQEVFLARNVLQKAISQNAPND